MTWGALDVPPQLNELIRRMTSLKPADRPSSAEAVLTELQTIRERPSGTVVEVSPPTSRPAAQEMEPATFQIGDVIDQKYEVQAVLPAGGSGRVYKVYDAVWDQTWALKVFNDTSHVIGLAQAGSADAEGVRPSEHRQGEHLGSAAVGPPLPGVRVRGGRRPDRLCRRRQAHAGATGRRMRSSASRGSGSDAPRCGSDRRLRAKMDAGAVSEEEYDEWNRLQSTGWYHRDIKPGNLMLTGDTLKLVDFNIAALATQADKTFTGTPGYMLPDTGMMRWDTSFDLFAVGVVLYELDHRPAPLSGSGAKCRGRPTDPRKYVPNLAGPLANLLLRAVSVDRAVRYYSARRFRQDLLALDGVYLEETPIPWTVPQLHVDARGSGTAELQPLRHPLPDHVQPGQAR